MLEACAFMDDGEALYYRTIPKEPVEIDDEVAKTLGDKVRRFETAEELTEDREENEDSSEPPKSKRKQRKTEEPEPEVKPEAEPEEKSDGDSELRS